MLKEGGDWIRHYLIIPFPAAGYMHWWHKWHTYADMLNSWDIPITLLLPSNSAIHLTHLEASPSSGVVDAISNPSMCCCHWDPRGDGEWTAWHLVPVLGHPHNLTMTVSQLSCSLLVILTFCSEGPCSSSAVSKEVKYTWGYALSRICSTSIEAQFGGLLCSGAWATALRWQWFGDSASYPLLSISLFAPMTYPVLMVLQAKASKGPWQWSSDSHAMSVLPASVLQMDNEANNLIEDSNHHNWCPSVHANRIYRKWKG